MINNDPNPNFPEFNRDAFKQAISMVESSGGKYLSNSTSSAAGKYHFLYRYLKDVPELKGISKGEFIRNNNLQEQVMDMALDGKLKGFTNYIEYAKRLKTNYGTDYSLEELAALTHFLGAGGVRTQLKTGNYKIPGKNASVDQYLGRFRKYYPAGTVTPTPTKENIKGKMPEQAKDNIPEVPTPQAHIQDPALGILAQDVLGKYNPPEMLETTYEAAPGQESSDVVSWLDQQQNACGGKVHLSNGGSIKFGEGKELVEYANGGSHQENALGGIPIGSHNGVMNTVEEGETQHGSYVFSDRIGINNLYKKK